MPTAPVKKPRVHNWQVLAAAALALVRVRGAPSFDLSDLTVEAWRLAPGQFGLKHFEARYPDAGAVKAALMHKKAGAVTRGALRQVGVRQYALTEDGTAVGQLVLARLTGAKLGGPS